MPDRHDERPRVLVADAIDPDAEAWLSERCELSDPAAPLSADHDAMIVRTTRIGSELLEAGSRLRVIAKSGSGTDNIDVATATRLGIVVTNCPGANARAVAEFSLTLILLMLRPVIPAAEWLRSTAIEGSLVVATEAAGLVGWELSSRTIGIAGWGRTGARVGRACRALGARVIAHDPAKSTAEIESDGVTATETLDELLQSADVVSVHVPLNDSTRWLIGEPELARMRPHAALVNMSRGGVVDEDALAAALSSGRLRCAATDVFAEEPPRRDHPLLSLPNALCTPHMGGTTADALSRTAWSAVKAVDDVLAGRCPDNVVNPEAARSSGLSLS